MVRAGEEPPLLEAHSDYGLGTPAARESVTPLCDRSSEGPTKRVTLILTFESSAALDVLSELRALDFGVKLPGLTRPKGALPFVFGLGPVWALIWQQMAPQP